MFKVSVDDAENLWLEDMRKENAKSQEERDREHEEDMKIIAESEKREKMRRRAEAIVTALNVIEDGKISGLVKRIADAKAAMKAIEEAEIRMREVKEVTMKVLSEMESNIRAISEAGVKAVEEAETAMDALEEVMGDTEVVNAAMKYMMKADDDDDGDMAKNDDHIVKDSMPRPIFNFNKPVTVYAQKIQLNVNKFFHSFDSDGKNLSQDGSMNATQKRIDAAFIKEVENNVQENYDNSIKRNIEEHEQRVRYEQLKNTKINTLCLG